MKTYVHELFVLEGIVRTCVGLQFADGLDLNEFYMGEQMYAQMMELDV